MSQNNSSLNNSSLKSPVPVPDLSVPGVPVPGLPVSVESQENKKQLTLKNMRAMCDRDREKVKGIFRFFECPGGMLNFVFRAYKWDPVERYNLQDGEIHTIPLGVAKHLNKNGWYPEHSYLMDETGRPHMRVGQKKRRFGFQSLEFIDPAEIGEASEVEVVGVEEFTIAEKASLNHGSLRK